MLETIDFITQTLLEQKGKLDRFDPPVVYESTRWQQWVTQPSPGTCPYCMLQDGRIYSRAEQPSIPPPVHPNCKCRLTPLREIPAGMATDQGLMGADFWLKMSRTLPEYYISEEEIRALGWQRGKSPARYAPGKMLTKGEYENRNGHLPQRDGRGRSRRSFFCRAPGGRRRGGIFQIQVLSRFQRFPDRCHRP